MTQSQTQTQAKTVSEQADELEHELMKTLDRVPSKSALYTMGEIDPRVGVVRPPLQPGQHMLQGQDPRLPTMPEKPTVLDFYHLRFRQGGIQHLLQSANLAKKNGHNEKIITACLLHDIGVSSRPRLCPWRSLAATCLACSCARRPRATRNTPSRRAAAIPPLSYSRGKTAASTAPVATLSRQL